MWHQGNLRPADCISDNVLVVTDPALMLLCQMSPLGETAERIPGISLCFSDNYVIRIYDAFKIKRLNLKTPVSELKFFHSSHKQFLSIYDVPGTGSGAKPKMCGPHSHSTYGSVGKYKGRWTSQEQKVCKHITPMCSKAGNLYNSPLCPLLK